MKIIKLTGKNFKVLREGTFNFDGKNATISGPNGVGKTTVFDMYNWLITGKDTQNKMPNDFGIKTKLNGEVIHNLVHSVEGVIAYGAKTVTLRREFKEIWTKKRGSNTKSFTGHTTDYFIDEVPMNEKQYSSQIDAMIACDFQMYSNPMYFSEKLSAEKRRSMLIDTFGNVDDADVILKNRKLKPLAELLEGKTIDMIKDMAKAKMKVANKSLEEIPARIDELTLSVNNITVSNKSIKGLDEVKTAAEALKVDHMANISKIKAEAGKSSVDDAISAKKREIAELKSTFAIKKREALSVADEGLTVATRDIDNVHFEIRNMEKQKSNLNHQLIATDEAILILREEFKAKKLEQHQAPKVMTLCPTCGQDIPGDKVQSALDEALAIFNASKSESLEAINKKGSEFKEKRADICADLEEINKKISDANEKLEELKAAYDLALLNKDSLVFAQTWIDQQSELDNLQKQRIGEMTIDIGALCEADNKAIAALDLQIDTVNQKLADKRQVEQSKSRIAELISQEYTAQKSFEENEVLLKLCEAFTSAKMSMLSELINSEFELASFKLFDVQINGGIKECCVVTGKDGVAWDEALNTGQKINVGLDIIKTFSRINGIELPIFIDNAESVTNIQPLDNQLIKLHHKADDSELYLDIES